MQNLIAQLGGPFLGGILVAMVVALFIQFACKIVTGFNPSYGMACMVSFMVLAVGAGIKFAMELLSGTMGLVDPTASLMGIMVMSFIAQCIICAKMLVEPKKGAIGIGSGVMVSVLQVVFTVVVFGAFTLVVGGILGGFEPLTLYK
ncbi:MAG: hypothetical protein VCD00_15545 [Candidatus Hydrogenedentota bacterium]